MKILLIISSLLIVFSSCSDNSTSEVKNEDVLSRVRGPVTPDTTLIVEEHFAIYEQYTLQISHLRKDIYVPFLVDSSIYFVTSHVAFKEINKDTIYSSGGTVDYFFQNTRLLKKRKDYEFSFYLSEPDFLPDTVLIWFKYYPDSLNSAPINFELAHSFYQPLD